jgi:hypothetical protein
MDWREAKQIGVSDIEIIEKLDNLGDAPDFNVWQLMITLEDDTVWDVTGEGFDYWSDKDWLRNLDNTDMWERIYD